MEVKKTSKAALEGKNTLWFLGALNAVLLLTLLLFNWQTAPPEMPAYEEPEVVFASDQLLIDIPEPDIPPPPPPPVDEPPPPPPPDIPQIIEQTPEPVPPPPLQRQDNTPPRIEVGPRPTVPRPSVDLSGVREQTQAAPQEERVSEPVTVNRVQNMAIYPGCERHRGNKTELIKCFSENFGKDIQRFMSNEFPNINKQQVLVNVEFHLDTNGHIINIVPKQGDDIFKPEAKRAVERAADWLKRNNKRIEPATMANGDKAILIFSQRLVLVNPNY
ncbi:MAG: hypothetical protein Q4F57_04975 [Weeksellaceae bacterium]|nr:hypothetical protein [Weeksellaceae bacterium]